MTSTYIFPLLLEIHGLGPYKIIFSLTMCQISNVIEIIHFDIVENTVVEKFPIT
jgi:hypothetical protein